MAIDWTKTLMGQDGHFASGEGREHALSVLMAGRMAGLLGAVFLIVSSIALLPWSLGGSLALDGSMILSILLIVQVIGFAALQKFRAAGWRTVAALSILEFLMVKAAGAQGYALLAAAAILAGDRLALMLVAKARSRWLAVGALALGLTAGLGGVFSALVRPDVAALLVALAIPSLTMLPLLIAQGNRRAQSGALARRREAAIREKALMELALPLMVVDQSGQFEPIGADADFETHLLRAPVEGSLADATLVIDRPQLLQALSKAIHDRVPTRGLSLRLRDLDPVQVAPLFIARQVSVLPLDEMPHHALVMVSEAPAAQPTIRSEEAGALLARADSALIQRALHDATAPFNASLGYLELMSDPALAPRDLASMRHYAGEARNALIEAHRNTNLMGRWLKLISGASSRQPERQDLVKLAHDAARLLGLADQAAVTLVWDSPAGGIPVEMAPDAARFALAVLLRPLAMDAATGASLRISLRASGADLLMVARLSEAAGHAKPPGEDMFQMALDQAAARALPARYSAGPLERRLVLTGLAMPETAERGIKPQLSGRLAS
jgi:hypothetical protein